MTIEELASEVEALKLECHRLRAARACENLMSDYAYLVAAHRLKEYMALWSKRPDARLEMPWGVYDGYEGVCKCYLQDHTDRSEPGALEELKGCMFLHPMTTAAVEVAADGKTARGAWMSPGAEAFTGAAHWCWSKYGVDFIYEDGAWKIWHLRLYPLFLTPYDKPFTTPEDENLNTFATRADHGPSSPRFSYSLDSFYPENEPVLPLPYTTFSELEDIIKLPPLSPGQAERV